MCPGAAASIVTTELGRLSRYEETLPKGTESCFDLADTLSTEHPDVPEELVSSHGRRADMYETSPNRPQPTSC